MQRMTLAAHSCDAFLTRLELACMSLCRSHLRLSTRASLASCTTMPAQRHTAQRSAAGLRAASTQDQPVSAICNPWLRDTQHGLPTLRGCAPPCPICPCSCSHCECAPVLCCPCCAVICAPLLRSPPLVRPAPQPLARSSHREACSAALHSGWVPLRPLGCTTVVCGWAYCTHS